MDYRSFCKAAALLAVLIAAAGTLAIAQTQPATTAPATTTTKRAKEVLLPPRINSVPAGNDFNNPDAEFNFKRSKSSDNFILFWAKEYGDDPMANPVANRRFNVDEILKEADRFFNYYVDTLKWVDKDKSLAAKYKFLFFVIGGNSGTAFGGSIDNKIGAFWSPATRISRGPYGVVAHELGHSFQAIGRADGGGSFTGGGAIAEMTSQYMLWQVYPEWLTMENYHLTAFMKATNLAFLHEDNMYHSAAVLEYWSEKHGLDFIGKLWHEPRRGEDPVMTYKRITNVTQAQFNDEMFDGCRRYVTWDMPRIEKVAARYDDQHTTSINRAADDWFQIAKDKVPQNYGYNAIKLKVPAADTKITLDFKGIAGAEGFSKTQLDKAGWRYGFLAHKTDGTRVYSDTCSKPDGTTDFTIPADTKFLWLVVMGAPTEHWIHVAALGGRGRPGPAAEPSEQWPYKFKLTGTAPDDSIIH